MTEQDIITLEMENNKPIKEKENLTGKPDHVSLSIIKQTLLCL